MEIKTKTSWRPDNWEEDKPKAFWMVDSERVKGYTDGFADGVEAGADALLEALKKQGGQ